MLVLSRRIGEQIYIDDGIVVKILAIRGRQVKVGIEAPATVSVRREELDCVGAGTAARGRALAHKVCGMPT